MATKRPQAAPAAAPAPAVAQSPGASESAPSLIKGRVLATGAFGRIDTVVELSADLMAQAVACGQVDPHPDAVAYAASLS